MTKHNKYIIQDGILLLLSIGFAIFVTKTGIVNNFIESLDGLTYLGIFIAGMFFTSVFTTAPSIAFLSGFAQDNPLLLVTFLGGLGAVCGDYIIFRFVKDRISEDINYLLSSSRKKRFFLIFKTKLFRWLVPFIGALIIASPFPDELGIAMLGLSKMNNKVFLLVSFIFNSLGIFVIGWIATSAM